ncbi:FliA/WhiG family RNA polymerase sigma factor [Jeotgalibacillus haloalkalitolerans]|uniref:FliA/WhiG family RNA polymerase sigma factor n=1 Tax=Jeotgalibacillus haloalkalitolerans TaxID=3104292 RepID=A0ABU5KKQ0_9BACL|nr:FliA/WhiG family RNA polymerase sigma factor [Jeotgalibacillus sp. HH7-29]MDZ5711745.1 FliA/WhiG family RNA polymerase sigma factor [Jeotgalibacillus sp. HH7-29]
MDESKEQEKYDWQMWTASRDAHAGDMLVQRYMPLVQYHVQRISAGLPKNVSRDDIKSLGLMGLLDALQKFDPNRDLKFDTYASFRVRGAIIDGLRKEDWMPRSAREKAKKVDAKIEELEQQSLRHVEAYEVAVALDMPVEEVYQITQEHLYANVLSMDDQSGDQDESEGTAFTLKDHHATLPEDQLVKDELHQDLAGVISQLNEKEQLVLSLFYTEELTLTEIGEVMNLSTSRISQIHSKCLFKLRKLLASEYSQS